MPEAPLQAFPTKFDLVTYGTVDTVSIYLITKNPNQLYKMDPKQSIPLENNWTNQLPEKNANQRFILELKDFEGTTQNIFQVNDDIGVNYLVGQTINGAYRDLTPELYVVTSRIEQ